MYMLDQVLLQMRHACDCQTFVNDTLQIQQYVLKEKDATQNTFSSYGVGLKYTAK